MSHASLSTTDYLKGIPRKRSASLAMFTDGVGRVLLVEPTYKDVWEVPGGAVELNESPRDAAAREVKEELGLVIQTGRLLAVDCPPVEGSTEGLIFVYNGGHLTKEQASGIALATQELRSWQWCTIEQARERMRPLVARRIEATLSAQATNALVELENGYPIR
ncbi:NUDIX domain-containing protein [Natronoglycomyces albus]|uniref:NUDIX hydrolase n=1 Tax=Natronoglycomyces albus TaxID=2811108 RepID=A0A895XNE9_9ACTN|nr:NUDIX hydrolase [Natronoglycomyces albus]QSB06647.1 NUDIX hydrolase [Natronoglycomyces albus]